MSRTHAPWFVLPIVAITIACNTPAPERPPTAPMVTAPPPIRATPPTTQSAPQPLPDLPCTESPLLVACPGGLGG